MEKQLQTLEGTVDSMVYANEDTGFTVFALDAGDELVTAVGEIPGIAVGEEVVLTGYYTSHPTYGHQFKVQIYERKLPATAAAIRKYLSSGVIKGIGPKTAVAIVDRFGEDTLKIIERTPEKLAEIRGLSMKKALEIAEQYRNIFGIRTVMLYLSKYGIEPAAAIRVWKQWGLLTTEVIERDPYQLCCEMVGVPFAQADDIALSQGMDPTDPRRLRAGIVHILTHNLSNGHTCLPKNKLLSTGAGLLEADSCLLEEVLCTGVQEGDLICDTISGTEYVYLPPLYEAETYIAGRLGLMTGTASPEKKDYQTEIDQLEQRLGIHYAQHQRKAIQMALQNNCFILTGGPGTGKTTTLNAILELLEQSGEKVALAAPTGRAAKRMSEVTGRDAKTIHRLLEVDFRDENDKHRFKRDEKNPLRQSTIILDEVSMVDTRLLHSLMKALRLSCRLILVGDPDQLPSVGPGNILRDLIESDVVPTVHLHEIFRQAKQSLIVASAHQIVKGETPDLATRDSDFFFLRQPSYQSTAQTVVDLCTKRLVKAYDYSPLWDIQVLAPSRVGALGTMELNRLLQKSLNPPAQGKIDYQFGSITLREQDKVMQVRNNYDIVWKRDDGVSGTGVFNGDIGIIEMIDRPSQTILIRYDDKVAEYSFEMAGEIEHAYAITIHKSQGSEFEAVILPLMNYHQKLYYRNILYTGVTRAKRLLIMLGQPETVSRMVANHRKVLRYTNLATFLTDAVIHSDQTGFPPFALPQDREEIPFPQGAPLPHTPPQPEELLEDWEAPTPRYHKELEE